ncbi:MAG: hypothetical protein ROO70_11960 [Labrenzia sp.]|jgi:hypothetical protein
MFTTGLASSVIPDVIRDPLSFQFAAGVEQFSGGVANDWVPGLSLRFAQDDT